jgi:UDP:flavonoid glycosyltransferase YjiC (YdhE family)
VHAIGFVPLSKLLHEVDLVVPAGGTGTVLASLAHGLRPFIADHLWNAERAAALGAAIVIDDPAEAGDAAVDSPARPTTERRPPPRRRRSAR